MGAYNGDGVIVIKIGAYIYIALIAAGLEVAAECHAVIECALIAAGLEVAAERHALVDCTQLVPDLEVAAEYHSVVECIPRLLLAWRWLLSAILWLHECIPSYNSWYGGGW